MTTGTGTHAIAGRRALLAGAMGFGLLVGGLGSALAQDAGTPEAERQRGGNAPHPAHIHAGSCGEGELGDVVAPLTDLVEPRGRGEGNQNAATAATSFTTVPLPLSAILGADHAINVHLSAEEIDVYIACGELGGPLDENGNLVVGLREQDNSRSFGVAFLAPGADGASTNVSVFVAEDRGGRNRDDEGTPAAVGGATEDDAAGDGAAEATAATDGTDDGDDSGMDGMDMGTPSADEGEEDSEDDGTPESDDSGA